MAQSMSNIEKKIYLIESRLMTLLECNAIIARSNTLIFSEGDKGSRIKSRQIDGSAHALKILKEIDQRSGWLVDEMQETMTI